MPRLYREAPLVSIWEGSGNVAALDTLRAMAREPSSIEAFFAELELAGGADARYDDALALLRKEFADTDDLQFRARRIVERMAVTLQGALLLRHGAPAVSDAFNASRLGGDWGVAYGTLPTGLDTAAILAAGRRRRTEPGHPLLGTVPISSMVWAMGIHSRPTGAGRAGRGWLVVLAAAARRRTRRAGSCGVVAGENFWGNIAAQIGGDQVDVTSIISDPNTDPHEYEADVHTAAALAGARLVIENGLGYDDFLRKLLSAGPANHRTVLVAADVVGVERPQRQPAPLVRPRLRDDDGAGDRGRAGPGRTGRRRRVPGQPEPGSWPANRPSSDVIDRIRARYAGTEVAYTERVPGYLLTAAGLRLGTPASFSQSIEDGNDPSPADDAAFENALTDRTVKVLIYNAQVTDAATKHLRDVATTAGVPVVGMTETLPPADRDYQTWQADQAQALLAALGG